MSLKVDDGKLFKKYCGIWKTISGLLRVDPVEPVYGDSDSYIKTNVKIYANRVNTNFQNKEVPKKDASYKYLYLIMLDSVVKVGKSIIYKYF